MFTTRAELEAKITELEGLIVNLQETVDKMQPVKEEETKEDTPATDEEKVSAEELDEIDALLQED